MSTHALQKIRIIKNKERQALSQIITKWWPNSVWYPWLDPVSKKEYSWVKCEIWRVCTLFNSMIPSDGFFLWQVCYRYVRVSRGALELSVTLILKSLSIIHVHLFLSHPTAKQSAFSFSSAFKMHPESDHFSASPRLPP